MAFVQRVRAALKILWFAGISSESYVNYLRKQGVKVGENVRFRDPASDLIDSSRRYSIEFGDNLDINSGFKVLTHDFGTFVFRSKYKDFVNSWGGVKIGSNIVIGQDVTVLKGVTIGDNCIIGIGSLITKSIPPNSVVAGRPARVICSLDDYYRKRKSLQVQEALGYGRAILNSGREPRIEDFTEEWVLFLTKEEYETNPIVKHHVDFRLKKYINIQEFLSRKKPFSNFEDFLRAIKKGKDIV